MSETYDAIYLSPHLDDAALSCGGQIAARARTGERVLVLTLFAATEPPGPHSGLITMLHGLFGLEKNVVAHRREEDHTACAHLEAEARHTDLPEAIYRRDPDGGSYLYASLKTLFGAPLPADRATLESLTGVLAELPPARHVFAPLGVGSHVDHRLTRSAAELVYGELSYYEEMPYVGKWGALRRALDRRAEWEPEIASFESVDLEAKIAACSAYTSQLEGLYRTRDRLERALRHRARKLGGERLWTRRV